MFDGFSKRSTSNGFGLFDFRCCVPCSPAFLSHLLCSSDLPVQSWQFGLGLYCEIYFTGSWCDSSGRMPFRLGPATSQRSKVKTIVRAVGVRPGLIVRRFQVMTETISLRCRVCGTPLENEREILIHICFECRRYGLLNGCWCIAPL